MASESLNNKQWIFLAGRQSRIEGATCPMQWLHLLNANGPRQKWGMKGQHNLASATKSLTLFHSLAKLCNVDDITMWHPCLQAALHHSNDKCSMKPESQGWVNFYKTSLGTLDRQLRNNADSLGIKRFSQPQPHSQKMLHAESKRIHCARTPAAHHPERNRTKSNGSLKQPV